MRSAETGAAPPRLTRRLQEVVCGVRRGACPISIAIRGGGCGHLSRSAPHACAPRDPKGNPRARRARAARGVAQDRAAQGEGADSAPGYRDTYRRRGVRRPGRLFPMRVPSRPACGYGGPGPRWAVMRYALRTTYAQHSSVRAELGRASGGTRCGSGRTGSFAIATPYLASIELLPRARGPLFAIDEVWPLASPGAHARGHRCERVYVVYRYGRHERDWERTGERGGV